MSKQFNLITNIHNDLFICTYIENKTVTKVISKMEGTSKDEENLDKILENVKKVDETCDFKLCKQV